MGGVKNPIEFQVQVFFGRFLNEDETRPEQIVLRNKTRVHSDKKLHLFS